MRDAIYTITGVDVSSDLASAKVFVTVQGDEETFSLVMEGLQRASGFLRKELGNELRLRRIPRLEFVPDESFDEADKIGKLLRNL